MAFAVMTVTVVGCGRENVPRTVSIPDVTKSNGVQLAKTSRGLVSGIEVQVRGRIDGKASIWIGDAKAERLEPGSVERTFYYDWFYPTAVVRYLPDGVRSGNLSVEYRFR